MFLQYLPPFLIAFLGSVILTPVVIFSANRLNILDRPNSERKIHTKPIPLAGGVSVFLSFALTTMLYVFALNTELFGRGYVEKQDVIGILLAGMLLIIGGVLDDRYNLSWNKQIVFSVFAVLVILGFGVNISTITNPLGGLVRLDQIAISLFEINGNVVSFLLLADVLTFLWLLGMMYTTKLLDGMDGLVTGLTVIASILLFFVSLRSDLMQYDTALLAIILCGSALGFLIFNWHPAKIFLGEGGSLFCGFMLGVISIIAGGKISTALLVMGIPILDVLWIIMRRSLVERKSPFRHPDKKHLHFRLLDAGLTQRKVVLLYYFFALAFGSSIFFIQGKQKLVALLILFLVMVMMALLLVFKYNRKSK